MYCSILKEKMLPSFRALGRCALFQHDNDPKHTSKANDIPCLPKHFFQHYAKLTHGLDHVSKAGMIMQMKELWFTKGLQCLLKFFAKDVSLVTHTMWLGE